MCIHMCCSSVQGRWTRVGNSHRVGSISRARAHYVLHVIGFIYMNINVSIYLLDANVVGNIQPLHHMYIYIYIYTINICMQPYIWSQIPHSLNSYSFHANSYSPHISINYKLMQLFARYAPLNIIAHSSIYNRLLNIHIAMILSSK